MKFYKLFIRLIIIFKIIYVILASVHRYLKLTNQSYTTLDTKLLFWKSRVEFIFIFLMSGLLIYLFNPFYNEMSMIGKDKETKVLIFVFGFILILTADWSDFIKDSPTFKLIQELLGRQ
jgi:amino acid permease